MGEISKRIIVPPFKVVLNINETLITELGGRFEPPNNLLNESSLRWVLERIVAEPMFGVEQYPTLADKAALLTWTIINNHIFRDGCKRTGMVTMMVFLSINEQPIQTKDSEVYKIAKKIALYYKKPYTHEELVEWISRKIIESNN